MQVRSAPTLSASDETSHLSEHDGSAQTAHEENLLPAARRCSFRTLEVPGGASDVAFDLSGLYLGVAGGEDARVFGTKQDWSLLARFPDLPKKVRFLLESGPPTL